MKTYWLCVLFLFSIRLSLAQNTDLPTPTANLQTLPANSYVIAMDNTNQLNNSSVFNYKSYGLIVYLLNNNVKIKWAITAGKAKDGNDIVVNAVRIKPTLGTSASFNFKAGPFVIFAADTTGVATLVDAFNAGISNANDKIKVYRTNASTTADIRYNMTGFIPKAAVLTDGGNQAIHINYFAVCNVPSSNYSTLSGALLTTRCFTFASEPHNSNTGPAVDEAIASIKTFVAFGGNFLAQCEAVQTYENSPIGRFQTTTGITNVNLAAGTAINYPNPDLSFSQYEGSYSISKGGSLRNWRVNAAGANNYHQHANAISDVTVTGASVSKQISGIGGLVFYVGNHRFDDQLTTPSSINGLRMYMNAFLTPNTLNNYCNMGDPIVPLPVKLISFYGNSNTNNKISLSWKTGNNESVDRIEVERKINESDFVTVASVFGTQNKGEENYSLSEAVTTEGKIMYRLKLISKDQHIIYSKIILFNTEASSKTNRLAIVTNPVNENLNFRFIYSSTKTIDVKIYDMMGRLLLNQKVNAHEGANSFNVALPETINTGLYILHLNDNKEHYTAKFEKL